MDVAATLYPSYPCIFSTSVHSFKKNLGLLYGFACGPYDGQMTQLSPRPNTVALANVAALQPVDPGPQAVWAAEWFL